MDTKDLETNTIEVVTPEEPVTATEQLIASGVDILMYGIVFVIVYLYIKFKDSKLLKKLRLDPVSLATILIKVVDFTKDKVKKNVIRKTREKNVKIDILDKNFTPEEIKSVTDVASDKLKEKIEKKSTEENTA